MTKFNKFFFLLLLLGLVACNAATPVKRRRVTRARKVQPRQTRKLIILKQIAAPKPKPYPAADDLKPEIPFKEGVPVAEPTAVTLDQTYGSPEETYTPPNPFYGPSDIAYDAPEIEIDQLPLDEAPLDFGAEFNAEIFPPQALARLRQRACMAGNKMTSAPSRLAKLQYQKRIEVLRAQRLAAAAPKSRSATIPKAVSVARSAPSVAIPVSAQR